MGWKVISNLLWKVRAYLLNQNWQYRYLNILLYPIVRSFNTMTISHRIVNGYIIAKNTSNWYNLIRNERCTSAPVQYIIIRGRRFSPSVQLLSDAEQEIRDILRVGILATNRLHHCATLYIPARSMYPNLYVSMYSRGYTWF